MRGRPDRKGNELDQEKKTSVRRLKRVHSTTNQDTSSKQRLIRWLRSSSGSPYKSEAGDYRRGKASECMCRPT
ncbi:hypothetical protein ASPBRDRAFT_36559 [Aspergillus brasiliensis CBS 101740]|uniref:Uncharacterized protein n=1 Tax=Aspergillus brasiliensis (strain CBS 101740 / IMI 381727 / IBT 21946) TaxID=767769 RepID=A0A1L9V070_ASPBC|nr:hypothetical protein ASPBRDRAFT_36559 [Aspergillus brasiliensis CBS 101740]